MSDLSKSDIADFYDHFGKRMINDYLYGNPRVERAIERVCRFITPNMTRVLDIGCGIGISSAEFASRHKQIRVLGVDISPQNIKVATSLFANDRITFQVSTISDGVVEGTFDLIAMLDVYEHIPHSARTEVHDRLRELLAERGVLILTVPSPLHQAYLRDNDPQELQIVDEDVTVEDAIKLSHDISATLMCFEYVSVWRTNDYLHIVIQRNPTFAELASCKPNTLRRLQRRIKRLRGRLSRRNHVQRALGIDVPLRRSTNRD